MFSVSIANKEAAATGAIGDKNYVVKLKLVKRKLIKPPELSSPQTRS